MRSSPSATITRLLTDLKGGNRAVRDELFSLVYEELLTQARRHRARWHGDHTMNTTALVHEAYLKLVGQENASWENRSHFLGVAANAMRHILIDYARARRTEKRGGDALKFSLDEVTVSVEHLSMKDEEAEALAVLGDALERLERESESESRVVECRVFAGMSVKETAEVLGVSPTTVKREWSMAKAWLYREMKRDLDL